MSTLRVATLNLRNRADRWLQRRDLLASQLLQAQPDLISLQEISFPIGQGHWLQRQLNVRLSGSRQRPYRLLLARKRHLIKGYFEGVGILTRLPVVARDTLGLGYEGRVALRANLELPSGRTVDFVALHLHHVARDQEARTEQVTRLMGWLNDRNRVPYQIIAGDFNETPTGPAIRRMKQVYRSAFAEAVGHEPLATFPTALSGPSDWSGCLDYIFVSPAIHRVKQAHLICKSPSPTDNTLYPSDHVGVLAVIEVENVSPH